MVVNPTSNNNSSTSATSTSKKSTATRAAATAANSTNPMLTSTDPLLAQAQTWKELNMQSMMALLKPTPDLSFIGNLGQNLGNAIAERMEARQDEETNSPANTKFQKELAQKSKQGIEEADGFSIMAMSEPERRPVETKSEEGQ